MKSKLSHFVIFFCLGGNRMRMWLRVRRVEKSLSQAQVAKEANISQTHYSNIEAGDRTPSASVAKKIAATLDFTDWYRLLEDSQNAR